MPKKHNMTIEQIRNLPQYKNKTDEELEDILHKIHYGDAEERAEKVLEDLYENYDLSEMNANDELSLMELARIFVQLEDLEEQMNSAILNESPGIVNTLNRIVSSLRKDASQLQQDLNITRKARKGDKEADLVTYIEDIKRRAKRHLEDRLAYVYCPKCRMLVANVWCRDWEAKNVFRFHCNRIKDADTGEICDTKFKVTSGELKEKGNRNLEDVIRT